ncbi:LON peptidase substrate-binding domain-containing protein [Pelomonas sp. SE-A7]|uniref:LON peptidase substrate-binding domain-containing protein n=1 Tax=Pelomonas sp. SE-A7 TaxID=3054953 RepID=UPI00259D24EE|nr:LON peptidase substrate-binding domain-containing protein [Pelomonas sp. SE-A7]MDM4766133.1 LON peptidase substrate-binding domain-containing protein [Pelomonas sp. SE-A7]
MSDERIELFPLSSVLFPAGLLELRIFEPRYLDLIQRCLKDDRPFGVVCLTSGNEVRQRGEGDQFLRESFESLGTLAHVDSCDRTQPGLLQIRCTGGQRFQLWRSECLPHGLWVGEGRLLSADAEVQVPPDLQRASRQLQLLLSRFEQAVATADLPVQPPYRWDDCGWLANRWCELLPLPSSEKQRLLALDNPLLRLELVADLLEHLGP